MSEIEIEDAIKDYKFKTDIAQIIHSVRCPRCNNNFFITLMGHPVYILICVDCGLKFSVGVQYKILEE
jgi:transcription elongation factor Elf1